MLELRYAEDRPGPGWHRHGTTVRWLWIVHDGRLQRLRLYKQRWLNTATGGTRHDRPFFDPPRYSYGLDAIILTLATWLLSNRGLHAVDWPWATERPARRTVQRWAAFLAWHADSWLQESRSRILDYVAPRPLEELLPAGIPPPRGVRLRTSRGNVHSAGKLRDVVWLHKKAAQALGITVRLLLGVARWRWPTNLHNRDLI